MMIAPPLQHVDYKSLNRTEINLKEEDYIRNKDLFLNMDNIDTDRNDVYASYIDSTIKSLLEKAFNENMFSSNPMSIINNHNYKSIVSMGKVAVPSILKLLAAQPSFLVWALNDILGFRISEQGVSMIEASKKWVSWGREMNLI